MKILSLFLAAACLFAAPPTTVIQDTVHAADGSLFNGSIVIGWPTFQAVDGSRVQGGSRTVDVKSGAFRVSLPVFDGYTVLYLNGSVSVQRETWNVAASATAVHIQDVRRSMEADANATSIQGITVDPATPTVSQSLMFDTAARKWTPKAVFARPDAYTGIFDAQSYAEGTVSVDSGSKVVTGDATAWDQSMEGWYLVTAGRMARILTVDAPTQLTLDDGWAGSNVTDAAYYLARLVVIPGTDHLLGTSNFTISTFRYDYTDAGGAMTEVTQDGLWVLDGSYDIGLLFSQAFHGVVLLHR